MRTTGWTQQPERARRAQDRAGESKIEQEKAGDSRREQERAAESRRE